ncbi:MAG: flagellar motor switch protein FliG [Myxococcota bacterium]|jgi:flagellar motor switch protein FliG
MSAALDNVTGPDAPESALPIPLNVDNIPGVRRAAVALMMLGPQLAGEILRVLSDVEVTLLLKTADDLKNIDEEEAVVILEEYLKYFDGKSLLVPRANEFVRTVAEDAIGEERVRMLLGLDPPREPEPDLTSLVDGIEASSEAIANVLKKEHHQTVAVALSVIPADKASEILGKLPAEMRPEVVRRIAMMQSVSPELLSEIGETLRRELTSSVGSSLEVDGQTVAVGLLKSLSSEDEEAIFEGLNKDDAALAEEIRKKMFVFEDLLEIDARALQMMLKEIDGRTLTLSLKTASTQMREHLLSSMSSRAATMILEDLEAMGPVAVNQIEQAQDEIVQIALRLAAEGKITLR